ncbi:hypothetical protein GMRT_15494 [Giardia muris]|uniref:Uncharacterized protein n=1 Tax=Giardia muris TaxID=5742 RepID=A0A4Z1TBB2_GIAMU|nr:hypothetical protein GMRT_15494 [Giardia muris]|eukprot:TNJ29819.1 hypothetical protein GMRT_15494 [Giardia muris]
MLCDPDALLVVEFCQVQGPTVVASLPAFPCFVGYTHQETLHLLSAVVLRTMSADHKPLPGASRLEALQASYNDETFAHLSYPIAELAAQNPPKFFEAWGQKESRTLHLLYTSTYLPDISARGYVRRFGCIYLSFDAAKLLNFKFGILHALRECMAIVKMGAVITARVDAARYVSALNKAVLELERLKVAYDDLTEPLGPDEQPRKDIPYDSLNKQGFTTPFLTTVGQNISFDCLGDYLVAADGYRQEIIKHFGALRTTTLPPLLCLAMSEAHDTWFDRPYHRLLNDPLMVSLLVEAPVLSTELTMDDVNAIYDPSLLAGITSLLECHPHFIPCQAPDLYVQAKAPLRALHRFLHPLFHTLFLSLLENVYAYYRNTIVDIVYAQQCDASPMVIRFGSAFLFPRTYSTTASSMFTNAVLHSSFTIELSLFDERARSQLHTIGTPPRFALIPAIDEDAIFRLVRCVWFRLYTHPTKPPLQSIDGSVWPPFSANINALQLHLDGLRVLPLRTALHYNYDAHVGHLFLACYHFLGPRIFNNVCTIILQGMSLILFCDSLVVGQLIACFLHTFSIELLTQAESGTRTVDRSLEVQMKICRSVPDFIAYCRSDLATRQPGQAALTILCLDQYRPFLEARHPETLRTDAFEVSLNSFATTTNLSIKAPVQMVEVGGDVRLSRSALDMTESKNVYSHVCSVYRTGVSLGSLAADSANPVEESEEKSPINHVSTPTWQKPLFHSDSDLRLTHLESLRCPVEESTGSEYVESHHHIRNLFADIFLNHSHELEEILMTSNDVRGLLIESVGRIHYWPKEKRNTSIVRRVTGHVKDIRSEKCNSAEQIGRKLQNSISRLLLQVFKPGEFDDETRPSLTMHHEDCDISDSDDRRATEDHSISLLREVHPQTKQEKLNQRLHINDAQIIARIRRALGRIEMDLDADGSSCVERSNFKVQAVDIASRFKVNSGQHDRLKHETLTKRFDSLHEVLEDCGIDLIDHFLSLRFQ